jgi:hypothetical protein
MLFVSKEYTKVRIRVLIKAYLVFNQGKRCTAKMISEWINSEWFGMNRSLVNPRVIAKMIKTERWQKANILSELKLEKVDGLSYYWVEA